MTVETEFDEAAALTASVDPRERLAAARRLARLGRALSGEERGRLVELLDLLARDPEPFVRWNVALALGELGDRNGLEVLGRMAEADDEHANVRFRVALAVGLIGDPAGIAILERYVADPYRIGDHSVVRAFAAIALGRIAHRDTVPLLARLARDEDPVVRWHAAVALGDVGETTAVEVLAALATDPIPFTRAHAAIGLAEIGDARGLPALEQLSNDSVPRVAQIASAARALLTRVVASARSTAR